MNPWLIVALVWGAFLTLSVGLVTLRTRRAQRDDVLRQLDRILAEHKRETASHD